MKKIIFIFFLALLVRFTVLGLSVYFNGYNNFLSEIVLAPGNDPFTYNQLALNLIEYKTFTYQYGTPPVSLRTPGYPLIIAFIYTIFGTNPLYVLIFQILIDSINVIMIFLLTIIIANQRIAFIAALLYAIEPHSILYSLSMYSDTLFLFLIVMFAHQFIKFLVIGHNRFLIFSGIILGLANLVKPSAVFIPLIVVLILFINNKKELSVFFIKTLFFLLFFIISLSPWLFRNYVHYNKIFLSTAGEYNLLVLNVTPLKMSNLNKPQDEAIYELLNEADSLMQRDGISPLFSKQPKNYWEELTLQYDQKKAEYWKKLALSYISKYPIDFLRSYFLGIVHSLANLGTGPYSVYFNLKQSEKNFNIKSEKNLISLAKRYFEKKNKFEITIGFLIGIYLIIVYLSLLIGLAHSKFIVNTYVRYFLILCAVYFILITGAGGLARFKLPSIPFYLIFSAVGIYHFNTMNIKKYFNIKYLKMKN